MVHSNNQLTFDSLVHLVRTRCEATPDDVIYRFVDDGESDEKSLTLEMLNLRARAIAALLQASGALGEPVLLLHPPGLDYIIALYGCILAGAIAVPAYPPDPNRLSRTVPRLRNLIADAGAKRALTTGFIKQMAGLLGEHAPELTNLEWIASDEIDLEMASTWIDPNVHEDDIALLQYTSGSTGNPRGVMLTHGNLLHNSEAIYRAFGHGAQSRGMMWLPPYHDMGLIGGILQPLYGRFPVLSMSPIHFLEKPIRWLQAISRFRATTSGGPNFAYDYCARKATPEDIANLDLRSWDLAFNGAEPIRHDTLERFEQTFAPAGFRRQAYYPCYGLAEATLIATGAVKSSVPLMRKFDQDELAHGHARVGASSNQGRTLVSSGQKLADQELRIVDPETGIDKAPLEVGEIRLAGPSIARGYWRREAESSQVFGKPNHLVANQPLMRTGDLGFVDESGELFVVGRLKDVIIVRGRNLYPQDIERTVEQCHPGVRPGCCAAISVDHDDAEQVVIVTEVDARRYQHVDEVLSAIRKAITREHDVTVERVVAVRPGTIPKTSSGKIQRRACKEALLGNELETVGESVSDVVNSASPALDENALRAAVRQAQPGEHRRHALVSLLVTRAAGLLRCKPSDISVEAPIETLAFDSLTAIEFNTGIERDCGMQIPFKELLGGITLKQLSVRLDAEMQEFVAPIGTISPVAEKHENVSLSFGQQALWFLHQLDPQGAAYNVPVAVRIVTPFDIDAFERVVSGLVERHAVLRTSFVTTNDGPVIRTHTHTQLDFQTIDATNWSDADISKALHDEARRPFDLERGALLRTRIYRRNQTDHVLLLVMHHIITDFWSLSVMAREIDAAYPRACQGQDVEWSNVSPPYAAYAQWQADMLSGPRGKWLAESWRNRLGDGIPNLELPTTRLRPIEKRFVGRSHTVMLGTSVTRELEKLAFARHTTLNTLLLAAFQVLLHRYTGQNDFALGTIATTRGRSEWNQTAGYFVNPLVLRARLDPAQTFATVLSECRATLLDALEYRDYPFHLLVNLLQIERDPSRSPLFQVMFVYQGGGPLDDAGLVPFALNLSGAQVHLCGLAIESIALDVQASQFDLTLTMGKHGEHLVATWEYDTDLFDEPYIKRLAEHFELLLEVIVDAPTARISQFNIVSDREQRELVTFCDNRNVGSGRYTTLHAWIASQVQRTPHAPAVIFGNEVATYAEVWQRAEKLAYVLAREGIGPRSNVGVCLERSIHLIVAMLGILRLGGVFVPIDPATPLERISYLVTDAQLAALLMSNASHGIDKETGEASPFGERTLWIESIFREDNPFTGSPLPTPTLDGLDAASIIYTSGSTGQPKGVVLHHQGLVNLVESFCHSYDVSVRDRMLPLTSVASASFLGEVLPMLCSGGTIVLPNDLEVLDEKRLGDLMEIHKVTIISTVPALIARLNETSQTFSSVRLLLSGGEALNGRDASRLIDRATLVNGYGLTETTICSTFHFVGKQDLETNVSLPIGKPLLDTDVHIFDGQMREQPMDCFGEIHVGGRGVAQGYWRRPGLTAVRFLPNPNRPGERMFRTGDLGRLRRNGVFEYLNRADQQVKIRGHRIEVGEIQAALAHHPSIRDAFVMAREAPSGSKILAAYLVRRSADLTATEIREWLMAKLPSPMIPSAFIFMDQLPLTANGKIDKSALPIPDGQRPALATHHVAPQSVLERQIGTIWQDVLGLSEVGIHDNFFELGGNSLLIARMHRRLCDELGVSLALVDMFKYPTVHALASRVGQGTNESADADKIKTEAQRRREALEKRSKSRNRRSP